MLPPKVKRKKKKLGSYPFVSVIFSITLSVFVVGIFATLMLYSTNLKKSLQENITIQVYLHKELSDSTLTAIKTYLTTAPFILKEQGTARIEFLDKDEAAQNFIKETGEDFVSFLGENPLRDAYILHINANFADEHKLKLIKAQVEKIDGVFEVTYVANLISEINKNMQKISIAFVSLATILLVVSIILIHNTIKLALYSQRFLIRSMQLVGATSGFIRWPFLWRSIVYGLLAGFLGSALLFGLIEYANTYLSNLDIQLNLVQENSQIYIVFGSMIFLGSAIGFFSTFWAITKYLNLSLDELY